MGDFFDISDHVMASFMVGAFSKVFFFGERHDARSAR